jgi:hypothetical protein
MKRDKFITVCGIRFHGLLLKGKTFEHRKASDMETVDCLVCREKVLTLQQLARNRGERGGRCVFMDLEEEK